MPQIPNGDHAGEHAVLPRLRRYLSSTASSVIDEISTPAGTAGDLAPHLTAVYQSIRAYLPQRLVTYELNRTAGGPWLQWFEGTLLFADVSGSTALAEQLASLGREGTEVVTNTLNDFFGTMIHSIEQAGGDLLSFGGDALLVLFSDATHAHTAASVAYRLISELQGYVRHVPGIGDFPLTLHIGVESGRVALVSVGRHPALRYSALGAGVARVARAETLGAAGEVVLGPYAWAQVAAHASGTELQPGYVRIEHLDLAPVPAPTLPSAPITTDLATLADHLERLSPYIPGDLLARIVANPQAPKIEADLRPVTVLFAQIAGLNDIVELVDPTTAAQTVDTAVCALQTAIQHYGGVINKLDLAEDGAKLLAIFGAPIAYEDHAERAARAALAMAQACCNHDQADSGLRLRIGINTGNVFAGNVGTPDRKEYTVMGDAVNVAARVMSRSEWGKTRCSATTAALIQNRLRCSTPQRVQVKGKREPLELWQIDGIHDTPIEQIAGTTALIGRDDELDRLRRYLRTVRTGKGMAVHIVGEAGLGKSRIAAELLAEARSRTDRVIEVRCLAYNTAVPFAAWSDVLRVLCGIPSGASQAERAARLNEMLAEAGISAEDWLPLIAELVGLHSDDNLIVRALDPQQRQAQRFEIILALLRTAAERQAPLNTALVIFCDNLQWADQISLDLWAYLAGQITTTPLLLLGAHRGRLDPSDLPPADLLQTLELSELSDAESHTLLTALPGGSELEPGLREQLVARAAGNPLFLEELLHAVRNQPTSGGVATLPDSLSGLMLARVDRLDERSRSILRVAAVIGQRFPLGVLQSIHPTDQVIQHLTGLDAQALTALERLHPERVHLFRHALMQEVIYQSLLYARRRDLHRRIGEYLEERYAEALAEIRTFYTDDRHNTLVQIGRNGAILSQTARDNHAPIFLLAHHYRLSDAPDRSVPYLLLAGHAARDDYANEQAIDYYRWALEILADQPHDPRTWEAREALGDVLCTLGRYDEAQAQYAAVLGNSQPLEAAVSDHAVPPAVAAEVLRSWGDALEKQGRYNEALERLGLAEQIVRANLNAVPPLLLAAINADTGMVLHRLGDYDKALAICEAGMTAVRHDRRSGEDERISADLQQQIGTIHAMRGDYEQARFHFTNALAAQEAIDDLYGCARSHNNLGYLAQLRSNYPLAVEHYEQAETLARKLSARYVLSSVQLNAAYAYYRLDRYAEATDACHDAFELCRMMGDRIGLAQAHDTLGIIAYNQGSYDPALAHFDQALQIYREQEAEGYQAGNTLALSALVHNARGDAVAGRAAGTIAMQIGERLRVPQLMVEALIALAEADMIEGCRTTDTERAGLLQHAAAHAERAIMLADELGSQLDKGVALRLAGEIAGRRGEAFEHYFDQAAAVFDALHARFELARTQARRSEILRARNLPTAAAYHETAAATFRAIGASGEIARLNQVERSF
jgi:adenylate cyclase